jgi:hypothetical protein
MSSDSTWKPSVPQGHTDYSWGKDKPSHYTYNNTSITTTDKLNEAGDENCSVSLPAGIAPNADRDPAIIVAEKKKKIKLPKANHRNILITSALPYVNNVPHLGNIIGKYSSSLLP